MSDVQIYVDFLTKKYNKVTLTRTELAKELNLSISTLERMLDKKILHIRHKREGNSQKAKYIFPILEVANYLSFQAFVA